MEKNKTLNTIVFSSLCEEDKLYIIEFIEYLKQRKQIQQQILDFISEGCPNHEVMYNRKYRSYRKSIN